MRRGFDGLAKMVRDRDLELYSGHLFVFLSRKKNRVKVLTWSRGGFVLWYKRLERGRFKLPRRGSNELVVTIDSAQLAMLVDGVDLSCVRRNVAWKPPENN